MTRLEQIAARVDAWCDKRQTQSISDRAYLLALVSSLQAEVAALRNECGKLVDEALDHFEYSFDTWEEASEFYRKKSMAKADAIAGEREKL